MGDIAKHQGSIRSARGAAISTRLWGLVIYGGIVAWCLIQLPTAAVFVMPASVAGAVLHIVRGRPILGAITFIVIVFIAPALFWPSMLSDIMNSLGSFG